MHPPAPKVRFYVDSLNFYYGVARPYGIKWIDMEKLLTLLVRDKFPGAVAEKIFIFTAPVKDIPPGTHQRQQTYLSALKANSPCVEIIRGKFAVAQKTRENTDAKITIGDGKNPPLKIRGQLNIDEVAINIWEEKRTDVNIGCKIVEDAYTETGCFDMCCLVSNDSDLLYPLQTKWRLRQKTLLIVPRTENSRDYTSGILKRYIPSENRITTVTKERVASCRLPDNVGKYNIPKEWA